MRVKAHSPKQLRNDWMWNGHQAVCRRRADPSPAHFGPRRTHGFRWCLVRDDTLRRQHRKV